MSLEKITQGAEQTKSLDLVNQNIQKLKELFPEVLAEGKIDFKVLQEILGEELEEGEEYYQFTWAGKAQARREAHKPSTGTLRPCKEESVDWDTTQNLYIEGDNLEVLKLMQKSYANKVKMIYIDPPYNTGKDFVYKDNYKDNLKNYQQVTGQVDDEGNKLSTNSESDGRYHSNWLNMMYPRLRLARNLLKEDGVIFISIDNNEIENLRKLADEIFGENNFISNIVWKGKGGGADNKYLMETYEYILFYAKNKSNFKIGEQIKEGEVFSKYDEVKKRNYKTQLARKWGANSKRSDRPNLFYPIKSPKNDDIFPMLSKTEEGCWRWGKDKMFNEIENGNVEFVFTNNEWIVYEKIYEPLEGEFNTKKFSNLIDDVGNTAEGTKEVKLLFDEKIFDFPKPTSLLERLMLITNFNDGEILIDFFSGSGSTAHALMKLNSHDNGNRKHIQVQLPETTDENSEAFKAGYKTIAEIGKERIRRAGKKIAEENPDKAKELDLGFKVFKLDSSNIKGWDGNPDDLEASLFDAQENIKTDRTEEDVLFEILLKYGLDLTLPIEEKTMEGKKVFNVGFGALFICLANGITNKVAEGIGAWKQELNPATCRVIFKDSGFSDVEKANAVQTLKRFGINEVKSI